MNEYLFIADALTHQETVEVPTGEYDEDGNPIMEEVLIDVDNYPYHLAANIGMLGTQYVVLALHTESPLLPGDDIVAYRAEGATESTVIDAALYEQIRPFGNYPDGTATGPLAYSYLDGFPRRVFSDGEPYPPDTDPYNAEARHKYFPDAPGQGWGFRFELIGSYETRDPSARAIGVYSDPACTLYLWTTGALQLGPSDWQVDDQGQPLTVWYSDSWNGDRPAEPKDWHIAVLYGAAQEGHQTLAADDDDGIQYLFWQDNQPDETRSAMRSAYTTAGVTISDDEMSAGDRSAVRQALLDLGIPVPELAQCQAMAPPVSARRALYNLLQCIYDGTITWPPQ